VSDVVNSFAHYLRTHRVDTHNCLVGLEPTKVTFDQITHDATREALESLHTQSSLSSSSSPIFVACDERGRTSNQSIDQLLETICQWAFMRDDQLLASIVRRYTAPLRGVQSLQAGDLVIVDIAGSNARYARFTGDFASANSIQVWLTPEEIDAQTVDIEAVFPLSAAFCRYGAHILVVFLID
jgi:hypothetical protein